MKCLVLAMLSTWLGIMGFFGVAVAPAAFSVLPRDEAGQVVGAVLARYYAVGLGLGALALAAHLGSVAGRPRRPADWLVAGLLVLMLALTLYAWLEVLPAARAAREGMRRAGPESTDAMAFARLHQLSTVLNTIVIGAGLGAVLLVIGRRL